MIVAFTGHRPDKLGGWNPEHPVVSRVKTVIRKFLVDTRPAHVISGMAQGVDQWAAQEANGLGIPFIAALPCDEMDAPWRLPAKRRFHELLALARQVVVVSPGPYKPWKMQRRNEWMVDNCDVLAAVWDGSTGGTANCVDYAHSVERDIRKLDYAISSVGEIIA